MTYLKTPTLKMSNKKVYGAFDDDAREYVITDPRTPYPWINYLGNRDFMGMISNTGGGYAFYRDTGLRRLTRYRYNNVPVDEGGRYFYIRENDTVWSPGWKPARTELDRYSCRHGIGYTRITGAYDDLEVSCLYFVPLNTNAEVHHLTLRNESNRRRRFQLFSYMEWCLWNAQDDRSNFQRNFNTGEVEVDGSMIYHKTEYRERRNHYAFYGVNRPIRGFDTDRDRFLGAYNGTALPDAVSKGVSGNSMAHGWSPIASHNLDITLAPGETDELIFVLGYVENDPQDKWALDGSINKTKARHMMERLGDPGAVQVAQNELRTHWDKLLSRFTVNSDDARLNRLLNVWTQYQCLVATNMSRSASLFESGISRGIGFRDANQDLLGSIHTMPERARQRIKDLAATQYEDGSVDHQYQPLTKKGNAAMGSGFNDDPLWLILSTVAYLKETNDLAFLDERVPFAEDPEKYATLFDHLKASFNHVVSNLGPHGLPLIGRADWNDCLNLNCFSTNPDESFQTTATTTTGSAESLMIAGLFAKCGADYADLCTRVGRNDEAAAAQHAVATMKAAVNRHGWDGRWFLRAYRHDGKKVGSCENREGQIFVESQGWCVMGGIGLDNGRAELALESVRAFLDCDHGVVVLYPAYSRYVAALGEISSYPKGYKENGAVFCHTNPWIVIAETMLGHGNQAFSLFTKTAPTYRESMAHLHKTEPYVYPQMIAGKEAVKPGEAKNSWLTGTAAWAFYAATQHILGMQTHYDGLKIDPCIPAEWKGFQVTRQFRGATYDIEVRNPGHVCKGVTAIEVNGSRFTGTIIPPLQAGSINKVVVTMGRREASR